MTAPPSAANQHHAAHIQLLLRSYRQWVGEDLIPVEGSEAQQAERIFQAPFVVLSHSQAEDPVLTYGNRAGMTLFEMDWEQLTRTPSRFTAEAPNREERARMLDQVSRKGFIDDYAGVRISASGRRFHIHRATVWNLLDDDGLKVGQAATFSDWTELG